MHDGDGVAVGVSHLIEITRHAFLSARNLVGFELASAPKLAGSYLHLAVELDSLAVTIRGTEITLRPCPGVGLGTLPAGVSLASPRCAYLALAGSGSSPRINFLREAQRSLEVVSLLLQ